MNHFDPTHDKLSDEPVTIIGGNKSAAAWHPGTAPEVPNADLIARLRGMGRNEVARDPLGALTEAADALAALGDTVPHSEYLRAVEAFARAGEARDLARRERDEARAERDALAHVIEEAKQVGGLWETVHGDDAEAMYQVLNAAPAASLALHDAEVKAQALDEAARDYECRNQWTPTLYTRTWLEDRAATIRSEPN